MGKAVGEGAAWTWKENPRGRSSRERGKGRESETYCVLARNPGDGLA